MDDLIPGFGRYQLLKRLGAGGMAEVFLARVSTGQLLERTVVVKRLLPHLSRNEHVTRMFLDEVRISASLQHSGIVQVFDFGRIEHEYFLALEYVWGRSLYDIIGKLIMRKQRMPVEVVVAIARDLCRALDYAHSQKDASGRAMGIVHRDVSPSNILISFEGEVKLADFGIARATDRLMETEAGSLKGKASYMAPEQVRGEAATPLADLYALGIMLYEALAMRSLFTGQNPLETLANVRQGDVPPLGEQVSGLPRELERTIMRMLALNPKDRFRSGGEIAARLEQVQRDLPTAATKTFVRQLFAEERVRDEEEHQRLFARARAQDEAAYHLRVAEADLEKVLELLIGVPTDKPVPLGARVQLILENAAGTTCLRTEAQVMNHAPPGMIVRPLPPAILPMWPGEKDATPPADVWLSNIVRKRRRPWILPAVIMVVAVVAGVGFVVVRKRLDQRGAARAMAGVRERMAAGRLVEAVDRLAAVTREFPNRPELSELQTALGQSLREAGLAAVKAQRFDEAVTLLEKRSSVAPSDPQVGAALRYARTGAFATRAGMVAVGEFWIDRYEFPNVAGAPPLAHVDWQAAENLCRRAAKRLCTEKEWEQACAGGDGRTFPYGDRYRADACVVGGMSEGPQPAGSRAECVTPAGIADLSGNVAEWTASALRDGAPQRVVRGGHWEQFGPQVSCRARDYFLPGQGGARTIGFRCCR